MKVEGVVVRGCGAASRRDYGAATMLYGIDVHRGTLNIKCARGWSGRLCPPIPMVLGGRLHDSWKGRLADVDVVVLRGFMHVAEVLAPVSLRRTFGFKDGDAVSIDIVSYKPDAELAAKQLGGVYAVP